jgi:hypothetical protein
VRYNAREHAVQLKHGGDLDEKRGEVWCSGIGHSLWMCTYAGYFDIICPSSQKCRVIFLVQVAFEEVGSGTILGTVNEDDTSLGGTAVYFDTLEYQGSGDKFTRDQRSSHI